jgi:hypothetical protein
MMGVLCLGKGWMGWVRLRWQWLKSGELYGIASGVLGVILANLWV